MSILLGTFTFNGSLIYTTGTVNPGTSTFNFTRANGTTIHQPNGITLAHVSFNHVASSAIFNLNNQTLNVTGNLTFNAISTTPAINSGTINASGNVIQTGTNSIGGTVNLNLIGGDTTLTPSGALTLPGATVTVNKGPGTKVTLAGNTLFNNAGQNLTVTSGTLDMAGYNLTVGNNISNSGILKRGNNPSCGTITQGGSYTGAASICP